MDNNSEPLAIMSGMEYILPDGGVIPTPDNNCSVDPAGVTSINWPPVNGLLVEFVIVTLRTAEFPADNAPDGVVMPRVAPVPVFNAVIVN